MITAHRRGSHQTGDFVLTTRRDLIAVRCFFEQAVDLGDEAEPITIDKSGANTAVVHGLVAVSGLDMRFASRNTSIASPRQTRSVERRVRCVMGFKSFESVRKPILGVDVMYMTERDSAFW